MINVYDDIRGMGDGKRGLVLSTLKQQKTMNPNPKPRFKPGQSGNPKGRPRTPEGLREALTELFTSEHQGKPALEAILYKLLEKAIKGDIRAAEALLDRAYGKPRQAIDHTTGGHTFAPVITVLTQAAADEINRIPSE